MFINELEAVLKKIDKNSNEVVFTGDFNLDILKSNSHPTTATYLDLMVQHGFSPKIDRPTRIKKQSATLIDHIFTRENPNFIKSGIINTEIAGNCGYTDHFPIFTILVTKRPKARYKASYEKSFFSEQDDKDRKDRLRKEDWAPVFELDDANQIYTFITDKYMFTLMHEQKKTLHF